MTRGTPPGGGDASSALDYIDSFYEGAPERRAPDHPPVGGGVIELFHLVADQRDYGFGVGPLDFTAVQLIHGGPLSQFAMRSLLTLDAAFRSAVTKRNAENAKK